MRLVSEGGADFDIAAVASGKRFPILWSKVPERLAGKWAGRSR